MASCARCYKELQMEVLGAPRDLHKIIHLKHKCRHYWTVEPVSARHRTFIHPCSTIKAPLLHFCLTSSSCCLLVWLPQEHPQLSPSRGHLPWPFLFSLSMLYPERHSSFTCGVASLMSSEVTDGLVPLSVQGKWPGRIGGGPSEEQDPVEPWGSCHPVTVIGKLSKIIIEVYF